MNELCNSAPQNFNIKLVGISGELAPAMLEVLESLLDVIGQTIDLTGLDGVTFAGDYQQALLDLDRGYETDFKLTPSNDHGVGIAMSPSVLRDGHLKTHIVISADSFFALLTTNRRETAVNTLAHECAHVELNHLYDRAFPGLLLRKKEDFLGSIRTDSMLTCWHEFGACWRSASYGPTGALAYETAFLPALEETRPAANAAIMEYRTHSDLSVVLTAVCGSYLSLLKYSAYHLGNLHGHGIDWREVPTTAGPLANHWFRPFFERLDIACKAIASDIGNWKSSEPFDVLQDIAEDLIADGGVHFERHDDGRISVDIPFSIETMPVGPHLWR